MLWYAEYVMVIVHQMTKCQEYVLLVAQYHLMPARPLVTCVVGVTQ